MTDTIIARTHWYPDEKLIITQISGDATAADIHQWEQSLHAALAEIEDNGVFKIFVNLYGFKAIDLDAHKKFRVIVHETLARYGWRVGYLDMFEEAANLPLSNIRGIRCVAAVHTHQDESKIEKYEALYSKTNEHFYADPAKAEAWIRRFPVGNE